MKFIFILLLPFFAFSCDKCINELNNHKDIILTAIKQAESRKTFSDAESFNFGTICGYYLGRYSSVDDCIRIMQKNHEKENQIKKKKI
jgi:hypothetical protein